MRGTAWTLALLLAISLFGIGRPLWSPDEPREAEIGREMLLSPGVVPTLGGSTFIEKPPLYYWTVAGVFALTGKVSPATARSVSAVSAFLTLLLVFLWGRREFSAAVGAVAAIGLATSARFLISTHWVIIDPLLMLFTTGALWAGWSLINGAGRQATAVFCGTLALALWTKGLIGPVLVGSGLAAYCLAEYRRAPWRRLRIVTALAVMLAATGVLAWAIYATAGTAAVREWFWVNHIERFFDPQGTGHEQPFTYYLWAIPVAMLPWWLAALESLRPANWRGAGAGVAVKRYWGLIAVGMAVVLSASATKREIYLLPLLPPLFLVVAANVVAAWNDATKNLARAIQWWAQVALSAAFATAPVITVGVYLGTVDAVVVTFLIAVAAIVTAVVAFAVLGRMKHALGSLLACTVAGSVSAQCLF